MKILDIGCGENKYPNAIGVDKKLNKNVDVVCDVEKSIPFKNNVFDFVWLHHVLEHIEKPLHILKEIHRVSKNNAIVEIHVPHFINRDAWVSPEHKNFFSIAWFDNAENLKSKFVLVEKRFSFLEHRKSKFWKFIFSPIDFLSNRFPYFYERIWAHWVGGSDEIIFKLKVRKNSF